jgi:hypothetical protein
VRHLHTSIHDGDDRQDDCASIQQNCASEEGIRIPMSNAAFKKSSDGNEYDNNDAKRNPDSNISSPQPQVNNTSDSLYEFYDDTDIASSWQPCYDPLEVRRTS